MSLRKGLLGLIVLELLARGAGVEPRLWKPDPHLGHALRPGASGRVGATWMSVNLHGMRDVPRALERVPGSLRVAVLGDGFTEAKQVARELTYPALLETALAAQLGKTVEVLNFGVGGYSTGQEYLLYRHVVAPFKPDVVLLQLSPADDVQQNHAPLGGEGVRPYFRRDGRRVMLDERFRAGSAHRQVAQPLRRLADAASDHSHLLRAVANLLLPLNLPVTESPDARAFGPSPDDTWREAWVITERMLVSMKDECYASGVKLMVVGATTHLTTLLDPLYPETRLTPFLVGNGVPFLPLATVFQRRKGNYHDGVYWNKEGHALAAELIAPWLAQHLH